MSLLHSIQSEFESIGSQSSLVSFTDKLGLSRANGPGQSTIYSGAPWGLTVEVRERWWDPSSVYTPQVDKHEATLTIDGKLIATIRFFGDS